MERLNIKWAIGVGVAIFVGFVALFWWVGLFDTPEKPTISRT